MVLTYNVTTNQVGNSDVATHHTMKNPTLYHNYGNSTISSLQGNGNKEMDHKKIVKSILPLFMDELNNEAQNSDPMNQGGFLKLYASMRALEDEGELSSDQINEIPKLERWLKGHITNRDDLIKVGILPDHQKIVTQHYPIFELAQKGLKPANASKMFLDLFKSMRALRDEGTLDLAKADQMQDLLAWLFENVEDQELEKAGIKLNTFNDLSDFFK